MDVELNPIEIRILGCLIEKEMSTPDNYPLSLNSLINACNQKSNRDPVMELDNNKVVRALEELRMNHQLAVEIHSAGSRVPKYKHSILNRWNFSPAKMAILCELFLRGPQTPGDLRARTSRLHALADHHEVEEILRGLAQRDDGSFVVQLPCEPGKRERRWAHLFSGEQAIDLTLSTTAVGIPESVAKQERIEILEGEVAAMHQEINDLKEAFTRFKSSFE